MKKSEYLLEPAEIVWSGQNPYSRQYGDIYGQENNFIQEKLNVFIDPFTKFVKDLPSNSQVTVCELGLGFGINLLLAADFWSNMPESSRLNFISVEKHPVSATDLKKMLRILKADSKDQFFSNYPINFKGHHTIWIKKNVKVLIVLDDVASALSNLDANVDFWFLDGFSPAKNECMWDNQVLKDQDAIKTGSTSSHLLIGGKSQARPREKWLQNQEKAWFWKEKRNVNRFFRREMAASYHNKN